MFDAVFIAGFWSQVQVGENSICWPWKGSCEGSGYGRYNYNNSYYAAHRVAYELTTGKNPGTLFVCHSCDNPICCNPYHLQIGTPQDNTNDTINRGRRRTRTLTDEDVKNIKKALAEGALHLELAKQYQVNPSSIHRIASGKTHSRIPGPERKRKARVDLPEALVQKMIQRRLAGEHVKQIAVDMGIDWSTVYRECRKAGFGSYKKPYPIDKKHS